MCGLRQQNLILDLHVLLILTDKKLVSLFLLFLFDGSAAAAAKLNENQNRTRAQLNPKQKENREEIVEIHRILFIKLECARARSAFLFLYLLDCLDI